MRLVVGAAATRASLADRAAAGVLSLCAAASFLLLLFAAPSTDPPSIPAEIALGAALRKTPDTALPLSLAASGDRAGLGAALSLSAPTAASEVALRPRPDREIRIYVYDLPTRFNALIASRHQWCRKSAFGTEMYLHEQMLRTSRRTMNPEEADLFFVPIYAACMVYFDFSKFDAYRRLVRDALDHVMGEHPYWNRSRGRDHVWPFVHDLGGCLSWMDNTDRVYYDELRHSIFLSHLGDLSVGCFGTHKDVTIPSLASNLEVWRDGMGGAGTNATERDIRVYLRGTFTWYHETALPALKIEKGYSRTYSHGIRRLIQQYYRDDDDFFIREGPSDDYVAEVRRSVFCLCPRGFATWSTRLFDAILLGCIPVIIADGIEMPFEGVLDYRKFSVKVDEKDLHLLGSILGSIPEQEVREKQLELRRVYRRFAYTEPSSVPGDAFDTILSLLAEKVRPHPPAGYDSWT